MRPLHQDDRAISSIIGAIVILAVLGLSVVALNSFHVPRQGETMELAARERAEGALLQLASGLADERAAPFLADLPLRAQPPAPPLLSGVILSPVVAEGALALEPSAGTRLTVSHVTNATAGATNDSMRTLLGNGHMRVYTLGNATTPQPVGRLSLTSGGAYLEPETYRLEAGAVLADRETTSATVGAGSLVVARAGTAAAPTTSLSWRIPLLTGTATETTGGPSAQLVLSPGPLARVGGGQPVHNATIVVETDMLQAWTQLLRTAVGPHGTVESVATGPDAGRVTATVLPPAGTPSGTPRVELSLSASRYDVTLGGRGG